MQKDLESTEVALYIVMCVQSIEKCDSKKKAVQGLLGSYWRGALEGADKR